MSCCDVGGRTKWGIFALLAFAGIACIGISGPAYFGILASNADPQSLVGCAHCVQDFGIEVLKSVNATDIADKLQKIHERNERNNPHFHHHHPPHHHHHRHGDRDGIPDFEFDEGECITNKDIDDLKPDLDSLVIPDWKVSCKDACAPVITAVPLAASLSGVLFFVGLCCGICSIIPLCMLCCGSCKDESPVFAQQRFTPAAYNNVPSSSPVGIHAEVSASAPTDSANVPLLQKI